MTIKNELRILEEALVNFHKLIKEYIPYLGIDLTGTLSQITYLILSISFFITILIRDYRTSPNLIKAIFDRISKGEPKTGLEGKQKNSHS